LKVSATLRPPSPGTSVRSAQGVRKTPRCCGRSCGRDIVLVMNRPLPPRPIGRRMVDHRNQSRRRRGCRGAQPSAQSTRPSTRTPSSCWRPGGTILQSLGRQRSPESVPSPPIAPPAPSRAGSTPPDRSGSGRAGATASDANVRGDGTPTPMNTADEGHGPPRPKCAIRKHSHS
jgi:hypothetical protein